MLQPQAVHAEIDLTIQLRTMAWRSAGLCLAGNEGMEKQMETAIMDYIGTTRRIQSFFPREGQFKVSRNPPTTLTRALSMVELGPIYGYLGSKEGILGIQVREFLSHFFAPWNPGSGASGVGWVIGV